MKKHLITILVIVFFLLPTQYCFAGNIFENFNEGLSKITKNIPSNQRSDTLNKQSVTTKQATPNQLGNATLNALLCRSVSLNSVDLDMANDALHRGANPNYTESGYFTGTPFLETIYQRNLEAVNLFISYGVDVNMKIFQNNGDNTPLYDAINTGSFEIVKTLVEAGANINTPLSLRISDGWTEMVAFSYKDMNNQTNADIFDYLVSKGANVNVKNKYGMTLLMSSANNGNLILTQKYLELGLDPNKRNDDGKRALDFAIKSGNKELINTLLPITN